MAEITLKSCAIHFKTNTDNRLQIQGTFDPDALGTPAPTDNTEVTVKIILTRGTHQIETPDGQTATWVGD